MNCKIDYIRSIALLISLWMVFKNSLWGQDVSKFDSTAIPERFDSAYIEKLHRNRSKQIEEYSLSHPLHQRWKWDLKRSRSWLDEFRQSGSQEAILQDADKRSPVPFTGIGKSVRSVFSLKYRDKPPLEYEVKPADYGAPIEMALCGRPLPGTNQVWFAKGSQILARSVTNRSAQDRKVLEYAPGWLIYSFAFSPTFSKDRTIYLFCNGIRDRIPSYNRILAWKLQDHDGHWIPDSQAELIMEWESNGHDGGDLLFGKDGYLYVATGDGSQDSDQYLSAQDFSDLRGGVLRIDVSVKSAAGPYRIPSDNPFLEIPDARPELYAKGLRNPWRMTMDSSTGAIYLGNSGQDTTESVYLLEAGANYGWSVWEGGKLYQENRPMGPGLLTFPLVDHEHDEARSLTGGIVYRGKKFPELFGHYIYGDYETGRIWGAEIQNLRFVSIKELANMGRNIFGFYETSEGEIAILGPTIYHLAKIQDPEPDRSIYFPRRLSETGLFDRVDMHQLSSDVEPYEIGAPSWNDGSEAQRFFHVSDGAKIGANASYGWYLPTNSIVAQTLSLPSDLFEINENIRVETRVLVNRGREWSAYSYLWNREQTDAVLVEPSGLTLDIQEHFGTTLRGDQSTWTIPSRSTCFACHNFNQNTLNGMTTLQLKGAVGSNHLNGHQLDRWETQGRWRFEKPSKNPLKSGEIQLVSPYDSSASLEQRVRSYLHVNCSNCHSGSGNGGNSKLNLKFTVPIENTGLIDRFPEHSAFGIPDARIVAPGSPDRSILLKRVSTNDGGKMPPLGRTRVDHKAVELISDWISSLETNPAPIKVWSFEELAKIMDERSVNPRAKNFTNGKHVFVSSGCVQCHRIGREGIGYGPDLTKIGQRMAPKDLLRAILEPSYEIATEYRTWYYRIADGRLIQGNKVQETDEVLRILVKDGNGQLIEIQKSEIEESRALDISSMPSGLLSNLTQDDIMDLVDFLLAPPQDH